MRLDLVVSIAEYETRGLVSQGEEIPGTLARNAERQRNTRQTVKATRREYATEC